LADAIVALLPPTRCSGKCRIVSVVVAFEMLEAQTSLDFVAHVRYQFGKENKLTRYLGCPDLIGNGGGELRACWIKRSLCGPR